MTSVRSGIGFDVHPLVDGLPLILGGTSIPHNQGLSGHSDGDVLIHSIIDSLLGSAGLGDIGTHFPSSDHKYKGVQSISLLQTTVSMVLDHGWQAKYVDATILAEHPVLRPFVDQMEQNVSAALSVDQHLVNIKAKTTDGLGFTGRGEGIAALSIVTLESAA